MNWCGIGLLAVGVRPGNIKARAKQTLIFHSYAQFSVEGTEHMGQRGARHALARS